jgi:ketosteroid isomerase-like protein
VEDRYKEWLAAANTKDAAALTNLFDENAVLMPKQEEPVLGSARDRRVLQEARR